MKILSKLAKKVGSGIKRTVNLSNSNSAGGGKVPLVDALMGVTRNNNTSGDLSNISTVGSNQGIENNTNIKQSNPNNIDKSNQAKIDNQTKHDRAVQQAKTEETNTLQEQMLAKLTSIDDSLGNLVSIEKESVNSAKSVSGTQGGSSVLGSVMSGAGGLLAGGLAKTKIGGKILGGMSKVVGKVGKPILSLLGLGGGAAALAGSGTLTTSAVTGAADVGTTATRVASGATRTGANAAVRSGGKALGKSILKKIPLIGLLASVGFGISRAAKGDFTGAAMEVASGAAGTFPGLGTATSVGIDAALMGRDVIKAEQTEQGLVGTESNVENKIISQKINNNENIERNIDNVKKIENVNTSINKNQEASINNIQQLESISPSISNDVSNISDGATSTLDNINNLNTASEINRFNSIQAVSDTKLSPYSDVTNTISTTPTQTQNYTNMMMNKNVPTNQIVPIIVNQPIPQQSSGKQLSSKGGTAGANAPLILATFDKSINALNTNFMSRSIPYYG